MEDFFRQVNRDARLLKRIGSDGFHDCGGLLLRGVTCCLRKAGLGNPGASVEKMAFDVQVDNSMSVRGAALSEDFGVDDDAEEEDDDGADAQTLSMQVRWCFVAAGGLGGGVSGSWVVIPFPYVWKQPLHISTCVRPAVSCMFFLSDSSAPDIAPALLCCYLLGTIYYQVYSSA